MSDFRRRTQDLHAHKPEDDQFQVWLGSRIRSVRQAASLNQDDFSYAVGVQRSYVGVIENGKRDVRISTLRRIASAFGLQLHELLDPGFELDAEQLSAMTKP